MKKKKNLLRPVLILILVSLIAYLVFDWKKDLFLNKVSEKNNAAVHYLAAARTLVYPNDEKTEALLTTYIQARHATTGNPEIVALLEQNEDTFKSIQGALTKKECDFGFGRESSVVAGKHLTLAAIENMTKLLLVKGRFNEAQGNIQEAANDYMAALTVSRHLMQQMTPLIMTRAIELRTMTVTPLIYLINSKDMSSENSYSLSQYLKLFQDDAFDAEAYLVSEEELYQQRIQNINHYLSRSFKPDIEVRIFRNYMYQEAKKLQNDYYGLLKSYMVNKDDAYLIQFYFKQRKLLNETRPYSKSTNPARLVEPFRDELESALESGNKTRYTSLAELFSKLVLAETFQLDYSRFLKDFYETNKALQNIQIIAETRSNRVQVN